MPGELDPSMGVPPGHWTPVGKRKVILQPATAKPQEVGNVGEEEPPGT